MNVATTVSAPAQQLKLEAETTWIGHIVNDHYILC
jgi:hypothetical protein